MHPLLRRNNNLWGDMVDIGTATSRPFLFWCAESDVTFLRSLAYSMSV
jgi:hypothetical protein